MENLNTQNFEEYTFAPDDFKLSQADIKIHDTKFQTKTTTYAKDAFKRFCKNKSSVVAAFIIGFLILCSIFVPIISPYDTDNPSIEHSLLEPRLFEPGTGFWDGTTKIENISWNAVERAPQGFKANAVIKGSIKISEGEKTDTPNINAVGGHIRFFTAKINSVPEDKYSKTKSMYNYTPIKVTDDGDYQVTVKIGNVENILEGVPGEYRISLVEVVEFDKSGNPKKTENITDKYNIPLYDWTTDHAPVGINADGEEEVGLINLNLSEYLKEIGVEEIENARISFDLVQSTQIQHLLIESIDITAEIENQADLQLLSQVSMTDANAEMFNGVKDQTTNKFPVGYWQCTGKRTLYQASVSKVSFIYDYYEAKLGLMTDKLIGESDFNTYIAKGWMEYDYEVGPESFKILNESKCPIVSVSAQSYSDQHGRYTMTCDYILYKYQGYEKMPKYILGTTTAGKDLLTLSFVSLRTSLLIAFLTSFVCLAIGLVWGSVSGYFGGNVDLAMERFCEILSGVPFIVVMTLVILNFGNTIGVFAFGLCITGWLGVAGRTRTQFYRFKGREYILASRTLGASDTRLIFKHILPNALGTIVTGSVLMIPSVIFSEASLSYLNLGLQGVESFGVLLSKNQVHLKDQGLALLILFPSMIISLLMISFNLFGNGLRDALNPTLKGSE